MSLTMTGKIILILEAEKGTSKAGKEWIKQGFVIDNGSQYNPEVCFSLFGDDKIKLLDGMEVGQEIEVSFNVSSSSSLVSASTTLGDCDRLLNRGIVLIFSFTAIDAGRLDLRLVKSYSNSIFGRLLPR